VLCSAFLCRSTEATSLFRSFFPSVPRRRSCNPKVCRTVFSCEQTGGNPLAWQGTLHCGVLQLSPCTDRSFLSDMAPQHGEIHGSLRCKRVRRQITWSAFVFHTSCLSVLDASTSFTKYGLRTAQSVLDELTGNAHLKALLAGQFGDYGVRVFAMLSSFCLWCLSFSHT